jgi:acetyl esterase/lipase
MFHERYPEAEIISLGDSAGSDYNLSFWHYVRDKNYDVPWPEKIIIVSPAMVVGNDAEVVAQMKATDPYDTFLSAPMLDSLPVLFKFPKDTLNYWTAPLYGDFSGYPPIYLFSGTWDMFYPQMKPFVKRVRDAGTFIEFWTGWQMSHDWPVIPAVPECEAVFHKITGIIITDMHSFNTEKSHNLI